MRYRLRLAGPFSILCLLLVATVGCSSVVSTKPLGEAVADTDAQQFEGVWLSPEGDPVYIRHIAENELRLAGIEWKDKQFKLSEMTTFITRDDDQLYVNVETPDETQPRTFAFMRLLAVDEDLLLLQGPQVPVFEKVVDDGEIDGTVKKQQRATQVVLTPDGQQFEDFVTPEKAAQQFVIDDPLVLRRIKRFDDQSQQEGD